MATTTVKPRTVSEDVALFFESCNLISPIHNNYRKISTKTISSPSSRSVSSSSSDQPIVSEHFDASFVNEEASEVEIPAVLYSVETYMYIGFTREQARILWCLYDTVVDEALDGHFMDYVRWHIERPELPDATTSTDDWDACLRSMGINEKLRTAILLPEFNDIRFTATCKYWVLEAMDICYSALRDMDHRLRIERTRLRQLQKRPEGQKAAGPISESPVLSSTSDKSIVSLPVLDPQSITPLPSDGIASNQPTPLVATTYAIPFDLPYHSMIWRAGDRGRSEAFYNQVTQEIDLSAISTMPGDFSGFQKLAYWTPQKETADRYAQWTKHKVPDSEIVMVQVAIPESLLKGLTVYYLWQDERLLPKDEWKKLVYYGRRGKYLPTELRHIEQRDLLIGHISSGVHRKFEQLTHWNQIKDEDVLSVQIAGENRKAIQWVFNTAKARDGFMEKCRGKIWLHNLGTFKVFPKT
ncbi:MAG: hypothetical protein M1839_005040 [Geoglossum umbratile]|nr:MAG: hypothetical protein M1839_005040 [Geoglossum umbratile]